MPSGSRKEDYTPEQYAKQLKHSRDWKERNREKVRKANREYMRAKRGGQAQGQARSDQD